MKRERSNKINSIAWTPGVQGDFAETYQFGRSLLRAPRVLQQFVHELDGVFNTAGSFIPPPAV
jgi:hypothetical protein